MSDTEDLDALFADPDFQRGAAETTLGLWLRRHGHPGYFNAHGTFIIESVSGPNYEVRLAPVTPLVPDPRID